MRGKVDNVRVMCYNLRITPAYAGKRSVAIERSTPSRDHPRLCGEKSAEIMAEHDAVGITPAYAGKR